MTQDEAQDGAAWWRRFQDLLDDQNAWPAEYVFKFIVPTTRLEEVRRAFGQVHIEERPSRRGRYTSVTARMIMHSSDEVVAVYTTVGKIEGVMALELVGGCQSSFPGIGHRFRNSAACSTTRTAWARSLTACPRPLT